MDPYDSDSSGFEDEDLTETSVLLGYASEELLDDSISHLGGWPVCSLFIPNGYASKQMLIFSISDMAGRFYPAARRVRQLQSLQQSYGPPTRIAR